MATPLRQVSENYQQALKRALITTTVVSTPPYDAAKTLGGSNKSPHASPIDVGISLSLADILSHVVRDLTKLTAEVEIWYRSRLSSFSFSLENALPPGLYTAIAHNGPLRRRIQDNCDEIGEFKSHIRHAQGLFFGWLATLYHLMLVVAWYTLGHTTSRLIECYKPLIPGRIMGIPIPLSSQGPASNVTPLVHD